MNKQIGKLTATALQHVVSCIPKDIRELMQDAEIYLAGGFIRSVISGETINDIDLFGKSIKQLKNIADKLVVQRAGHLQETQNAFTVLTTGRIPVQFIHRWLYKDPCELLNNFDFTIASSVVWFDQDTYTWTSACHPTFYADLAAKSLVYNNPNRKVGAGGSMLRICKFLQRGYHIDPYNLASVMAHLFDTVYIERLNKPFNIRDILTSLLIEVDPSVTIDDLDIDIEHTLPMIKV